ncbi:hypothetical protein [Thalassobaculum sp.]|uniref:hypothetical protein n=1 Tax=Thalassobaculum sp. TaxID=2022740 RepID=UPI0032F04DFA
MRALPPLARNLAVALMAAGLAGCGPAASAMGLASLFGGSGGGGDRTGQPGPFAMKPTAQNGNSPDPSIGQALGAADAKVLEHCRKQLPAYPAIDPGQCASRPTCLPGARSPLRLQICNTSQEPLPALATGA